MVCGDFNSTPNSHLLKFMLSSHLDYSNLSAMVIAGYYAEGGARHRNIPVPLLPGSIGIDHNSTYRQQQQQDDGTKSGRGNGRDAAGVNSRVNTTTTTITTAGGFIGGSHDAQPATATARGRAEFKPADVQVVTTTDATEDRPVRSTRSIRGGGKGKARTASSLNSEPPSLLGSPSSTKRRWGGGQGQGGGLDDSGTAKSSPSGGSSVGELVIGDPPREVNRSPHSAGSSSMESSMSREDTSSSGNKTGKTGQTENSVMESSTTLTRPSTTLTHPSKTGQTELKENSTRESSTHPSTTRTHPSTKLTHPFKLITAYPISKSDASAVTTYHHCAFETVDYIFFSPVSCSSVGKSLAGFNLLQRRVLPSTHTLLDLGPQPHNFLSSDHLLIQAMFQFSW